MLSNVDMNLKHEFETWIWIWNLKSNDDKCCGKGLLYHDYTDFKKH